MTIEHSHGKARPTLPRASDLRLVQAERNPTEGRTGAGHFAPGNRHGVGARWKATIKKLLGRTVDDHTADEVGRDASRVYRAVLQSMPCDDATVRGLVALHARHMAVSAYLTGRAASAGLDTKEGLALLEVASHHGQRAERTAVTALDVATKLAASKAKEPKADALADFRPPGAR